MDLKQQEKISKLMREQAEKLGKALAALRRINGIAHDAKISEAREIAGKTIREIADHGKHPQDL